MAVEVVVVVEFFLFLFFFLNQPCVGRAHSEGGRISIRRESV